MELGARVSPSTNWPNHHLSPLATPNNKPITKLFLYYPVSQQCPPRHLNLPPVCKNSGLQGLLETPSTSFFLPIKPVLTLSLFLPILVCLFSD
jgi:hypothetical protein